MNEIQVQHKPQLGRGMYHQVFPYHKFQDKIIKTKMGDLEFIKNNPHLLNKNKIDKGVMDLFKKHPDLFAHVFKVTDNYAVIEKLNTVDYKKDALKIMQGIFRFILSERKFAVKNLPYSIDPDIAEPDDIDTAVFFWNIVLRPNKSLIKQLIKYVPKDLFLKFYNFFKKVDDKNLPLKMIDIHDGNIGYNKQSELRLLDV